MSHPSDTNRGSMSPRSPNHGETGALALVQDHRERWRRGERIRVESYLERSHLPRVGTTALLDLVYNEVVLREEDGEAPRLDEYLERFPVHAEALRAQFEIHEALRSSGSFNITLNETSVNLSVPARDSGSLQGWTGIEAPTRPRADSSGL